MPPEVYLEIDHVDGNKNNNAKDGGNYQLLCRTDNRKKNPRGKAVRKVFINNEINADDEQMSPEMRQNRRAEAAFRHWLYEKIKAHGRYPVKDAIFAGAERVQCSPYAIRTSYLPKMVSSEGMYVMFDDSEAKQKMLMFRSAAMIGVDAGMIELPVDEGEEDDATTGL